MSWQWPPMLPDRRVRGNLYHGLRNLGLAGLLAFILSAAIGPPRLGDTAIAQDVKPAAVDVDYAVTTQNLDQAGPVAVFNAQAGNYLVVYEHVYLAADHDLHAQRIGRDGQKVSIPFVVANTYDSELYPDVAYNSTSGDYLVVWERVISSSNHDIYAQRVNSTGDLVGGAFAVASTGYSEAYPAVAYNATRDEYLVVWQQPDIESNGIYGRRVDADGTLLGATIIGVGIAGSGGTLPYQPDVAWDSVNDRYLVVWAKYTGSEYNIAGERVTGDGTPVEVTPLVIESWEHNQLKPKVAYNPHWGEFTVVWEDHHWADGATSDIYARRVDDSGVFNSERFGVAWELAPDDTKDRLNPVIVYKASAREYMVSWEYAYSGTDHDIYRRRLDASGALLENEQIVINTGNTEQRPTIAADDAELYLVAWEDSRNLGASGVDIYAALPPTDYFSGHVYDGTAWETVAPLTGVTVQLYCSNSEGNLGTLLQTDTTDAAGGYQLAVVRNCEFWHLVETDPAGYQSVASRTTGGAVVTVNYIRYAYPLTGKVFSDNDFLDTPQTPDDSLPPGNWANFAPAGWVTQQTTTVSVQVEDTGTGLNVASAEFAYSTDGGATWGDWRPATCSGSNGATTPQTITAANVPFGQDSAAGGQNRIKFRINDMQGNLGASGVYSVAIDSIAPATPTGLQSTSHQTSVWSKDNTVDAAWNAVTDGGSGLAGYSVEWAKAANTTPDIFVDTTATAITSSALENTDLWYVHVRAVDKAGNLSAAAHLGPFYIDALAPLTSVGFLDPNQGSLSFTVNWSEATTYGSPFAGFDIQVVDTWDGGSNTTTWQSNTLQTSATYTGVRGHTYAFYSRGRDQAGNQEAYPATPDATTTVGKNMTVVVVNEANQRVNNAQTFLNGVFVGGTNTNGEWVAQNVLVGDQMAARVHVYTQPAGKPDHAFLGFSGANWSWNAYITSVGFNAAGDPQFFQVAGLDQSPTLTLRKTQALIGFHVLVAVEWDASAAYLADLKQGLEGASAYLYDVSDGQMVFETVEVTDNRARWAACDMRIHASNQVWPNASIDGITQGTDKHIYMGRFFSGSSSNSGEWKFSNGHRTFIHEFGHYGLALYDEYLDRNGEKKADAFCATNFDTTPVERRASFMFYQFTATEMCSSVDANHTHRTNTLHDKVYGECIWDSVADKHKDATNRWLIRTPVDRGAVMPGPNAIAVADWSKVYVTDASTTVCAPYVANVDMSAFQSWPLLGEPEVWVDPACSSCPDLKQGKLDQAGNLTILGAHNGDTLRVSVPMQVPLIPINLTLSSPIQCSTGASAAETAAETPVAPVAVAPQPDAFGLLVTVNPGAAGKARITVEPSVALAQPPTVELWQTGADAAVPVPMTLPSGQAAWTGEASLQAGSEPSGYVFITAQDAADHTVWRRHEFAFTALTAGELMSEIYSADGVARLVVRSDTLTADAVVSIQTAAGGDTRRRVQVGAAYGFTAAGVTTLAGEATIHMTYPAEQSAGLLPASLGLYRWDGQAGVWVAQASTHDAALHLVSASVDELGVYAILGLPEAQPQINLPFAARNPTAGASQAIQALGPTTKMEKIYLFLPGVCQAKPSAASTRTPPAVDAKRDLPHAMYLPVVQ